MTGGILQLQKTGAQDLYLTGNPQISFFKTVYRRYTNFAMDFFKIEPEVSFPLRESDSVTYKFFIKRNADLISNIFFCFDIPDIYSTNDNKFRWIKNLGFNIIERATIYIGGTLIDETYGEWFDIWNELSNNSEKKKIINDIIGNVPELYNPEEARGNSSLYPESLIGGNTNTGAPSILARKIRVPLIFWFNKNPSLALPLIALQYHPVEINIQCRKIQELYTVIDDRLNSDSSGKRIKPNNIKLFGIHKFIDGKSIATISGKPGGDDSKLNAFDIKPFLDINYIFLDSKEMRNFALTSHEYLIEQVKKSTFESQLGNKSLELKNISHPISYMVIIAKRDDIKTRNDWNNYTNWVIEDIPPYSLEYINPYFNKYEVGKNKDSNKKVYESSNTENFAQRRNKNCLEELNLILNGVERISAREINFFSKVQTLNYFEGYKEGIYPYSFSINPLKFQPSGSCNMSLINNIILKIKTQDVNKPDKSSNDNIEDLDNPYKYDINIYSVNYNILNINSGMASLKFSG